jgi:hypothetical protein
VGDVDHPERGDASLLQKLGGWKSHAMVIRYPKLSVENLRRTASIIDGVMPPLLSKPKLVVNR